MNKVDEWGVEWIVAILAPWAIAPHPNFQEPHAGAAARLALISDSSESRAVASPEIAPWEEDLLDHASESLDADKQERAVHQLWRVAHDLSLAPGARAAAATYASIGSAELGQPDLAVEHLRDVIRQIASQADENSAIRPSGRLVLSTLRLHLALRQLESGGRDNAFHTAKDVLLTSPTVSETQFDTIQTSRGISWGGIAVQRDISRSIRMRATAIKSITEERTGHSWVEVVRGRSTWIDHRLTVRQAGRDNTVLRDLFEYELEADSRIKHFGRSTAISAGYRALLLAELSADYSRIQDCREDLAKILLVDRASPEHNVREGLRLLRQSDSSRALSSALRRVRSQGPSRVLVEQAEITIRAIGRMGFCSMSDLILLENSAEFMSVELRNRTVRTLLKLSENDSIAQSNAQSLRIQLWKSLSNLVPHSESQEPVAEAALREVVDAKHSPAVADVMARVVSEIDWTEVDASVSSAWKRFARDNRSEPNALLIEAIDAEFNKSTGWRTSSNTLESAALLVDHGAPPEISAGDLESSREAIVQAISSEVSASERGSRSFGGISTANVAVAYALKFDDPAVWESILEHLSNLSVDTELKSLAVDRLARNAQQIPEFWRNNLAGITAALDETPRGKFFAGPREPEIFAEALRLKLALKLVPKDVVLPTLMRLVSGDVPGRVEAARTVPYALHQGDATWAHTLLLQLTHDTNHAVRAEAGESLVATIKAESDLSLAIRARITELVQSDGIKVPLRVLYGIQRMAPDRPDLIDFLHEPLKSIAADGSNTIVRGAARIALELYENASPKR